MKDKIKNLPLFFAGLISLFFSVGHWVWGNKFVLSKLFFVSFSMLARAACEIAWVQGSIPFFAIGIALIYLSLRAEAVSKKFLCFCLFIVLSELAVFLTLAIKKFPFVLKQAMPQGFLSLVLIGLLFYSIRKIES